MVCQVLIPSRKEYARPMSNHSKSRREHPLSWSALARVVAVVTLAYLVYTSVDVFIVVILSLIIAASLSPMAAWLHNRRIPRIIAIFLVILLILIPLAALVTITVLTFGHEFPRALDILTPLLGKFHVTPASIKSFSLADYMRLHFGSFLNSTKQIALAVTAILTTIFLTFYLMFDAEHLYTLFIGLFPKSKRAHTRKLLDEIAAVVGQYIRGNLLISLICIVVIYAGLAIMHIPFALPLAIFTGILDLLPVIGPVIGAFPALILGFAISPVRGLLVLVLYVAYKQLEDVVIGPAIYNKALNLSAALIFLSVVIGAGVFGIPGAFLALPVAASIPVIIKYKDPLLAKEGAEEEQAITSGH